jgi:hypothetical protein
MSLPAPPTIVHLPMITEPNPIDRAADSNPVMGADP